MRPSIHGFESLRLETAWLLTGPISAREPLICCKRNGWSWRTGAIKGAQMGYPHAPYIPYLMRRRSDLLGVSQPSSCMRFIRLMSEQD